MTASIDPGASRVMNVKISMRSKGFLGAAATAAAVAVLGAATPALAHHSFAIFDMEKTKVFTGVVTRVNPDANHLQIFFAPMMPSARTWSAMATASR